MDKYFVVEFQTEGGEIFYHIFNTEYKAREYWHGVRIKENICRLDNIYNIDTGGVLYLNQLSEDENNYHNIVYHGTAHKILTTRNLENI